MEYEFDAVKEETDARLAPGKKSLPTTGEAHLYMKVRSFSASGFSWLFFFVPSPICQAHLAKQ